MIPIALRFDPECKFTNKTAFPIAKNDVLVQKNAHLPFGQSGSSEPPLDATEKSPEPLFKIQHNFTQMFLLNPRKQFYFTEQNDHQSLKWKNLLTVCLSVLSAEDLCKQFGTKISSDLDPNLLTL